MDTRESIAARAKELGVHECGFLPAKDIPASKQIRDMCEMNRCGAYQKSWACPPGVGTLEECRQEIDSYQTAFVFTTKHDLEDQLDWEGMMDGKVAHGQVVPKVEELFRNQVSRMRTFSTEGCARCKTCTYPDAPCRFPGELKPSIESYGVEVSNLARKLGIHYINGVNTVTYFSCIVFDE